MRCCPTYWVCWCGWRAPRPAGKAGWAGCGLSFQPARTVAGPSCSACWRLARLSSQPAHTTYWPISSSVRCLTRLLVSLPHLLQPTRRRPRHAAAARHGREGHAGADHHQHGALRCATLCCAALCWAAVGSPVPQRTAALRCAACAAGREAAPAAPAMFAGLPAKKRDVEPNNFHIVQKFNNAFHVFLKPLVLADRWAKGTPYFTSFSKPRTAGQPGQRRPAGQEARPAHRGDGGAL